MERMARRAGEIVAAGAAALGTGALAGIAAYGCASMLGTASTGTAIATLSGAAAESATLAWFGGGTLAAGEKSMAGGVLVLGGVAMGPAAAVGGSIRAHQARKRVEAARNRLEAAGHVVRELEEAAREVRKVESAALDVRAALLRMAELMDQRLDGLQRLISSRGADVTGCSPEEVQLVRVLAETAAVTQELLECRLLTEAGAVDPDLSSVLARALAFILTPMSEQG